MDREKVRQADRRTDRQTDNAQDRNASGGHVFCMDVVTLETRLRYRTQMDYYGFLGACLPLLPKPGGFVSLYVCIRAPLYSIQLMSILSYHAVWDTRPSICVCVLCSVAVAVV